MTNNTGKKNHGRKKYNYLDKKGTTLTRQDYIETNYVNGVKDEKGEQVIRPLTEYEKQWLSQFIAETEHGNLNKTSQIKEELKSRKALRADWNYAKRKGNVEEMLRLEPLIQEKTKIIERLRENSNNFYFKEEDVREIYDRDYERRMDVYNTAKISDNLVLYDLNEYDKFSTEAEQSISPEDLCLEHLHYVPQKRKK